MNVPVAATLANLLPEESIDFRFFTLDFYVLFLRKFPLQLLLQIFHQRKVFNQNSISLLQSVGFARHARLDASDHISDGPETWIFFSILFG